MIRIIRGVYGYVDEHGSVQPKTNKDEPFFLTEEREAELVDKGVAEYVENKAESKPETKPEPKKSPKLKKTGSKKKNDEADEEPPTFDAIEPE